MRRLVLPAARRGEIGRRAAVAGIRNRPVVPHLLSAGKLQAFLRKAQSIGIQAEQVLATHDLPVSLLDEPSELVRFEDAVRALGGLAGITPPDFALRLGFDWSFREFGLAGYALLTCRSFGQFVDRWLRCIEFIGHPLTFQSVVAGEGWYLEMRPRAAMPDEALRLCVEEACASVFPVFAELTGTRLIPLRVDISVGASQRDLVTKNLLCAEIHPAARQNRLVMRLADRALPLRVNESDLLSFCSKHCDRILGEAVQGPELVREIRNRLLLSCGRPGSAADIAARLRISKRSLNRYLARQGWTYARLVEGYRRDLALELLRTRTFSVKEIAYLVGFNSPETFRRAFRWWTGQTAGSWTKQYLGDRAAIPQ